MLTAYFRSFCQYFGCYILICRVYVRLYLMTLYVIFRIHLDLPIRSSCALKASIHRKKQWIVLQLRKFFLFQKDSFYEVVHTCGIWLISPFYYNMFLFFIFFIYHLSIIFAMSCSAHAVLSWYFYRIFPLAVFL